MHVRVRKSPAMEPAGYLTSRGAKDYERGPRSGKERGTVISTLIQIWLATWKTIAYANATYPAGRALGRKVG